MRAIRTYLPRRVWAAITVMVLLTLGRATRATAQDFTDYKNCLQPGTPWVLCTPVYNMPIGTPEVSLAPSSSAPGWIVYDPSTKLLSADGSGGLITYFNALGNWAVVDGGALALRVNIGQDGKFIGGAGGACGIGSTDDFCVTGQVIDPQTGIMYGQGGSVLRGKIIHSGFKKNAITHDNALFDDYEFHVLLTGGDLYTNKILPAYGSNELAVEVFGYNDQVSYTGSNPFSLVSGFAQSYLMAYSGPTNTSGILFDDLCDGRISGSVTNYLNPFQGIPGASMQLTGSADIDADDLTGAYASGALCIGTYQVKVLPPAGWIVYGSDTATVTISKLASGHDSVISNVNFKLYSSPISSAAYITFTQAAWGTKPRGSNAGSLLKTYFYLVYPEEVVVGIQNIAGRYSLTLTGPQAIEDFLPQNTRPVPLTRSYVDPANIWKLKHLGKLKTHERVSELAGEVVALELNVRFSAYSITRMGLGALKVQSGPLAGYTVDQVLALGNRVLGGDPLPPIFKNYDDLEDIIEKINKNFEAGSPTKGYVK
jgi:hypothetical protein